MRSQRGNILFLILLAIILFAALTYAVNSGLRGGSPDALPKEKARTFAAQLLQNAGLIEQTIMRERTVNGVPEWGFDMKGTNVNNLTNGACTANNCRLFSGNGGLIDSIAIPDWASTEFTNIAYRRLELKPASILNIGTSAPDLLYQYRFLRREVCEAINTLLGHGDIDLNNFSEAWGAADVYSGTLTSFPTTVATLGDQMTTLKGKSAFCFNHSTEGYTFVYTVMAR